MKTSRILIAVILMMVVHIVKGYGQDSDSTRRVSVRYYSRVLKTDSVTARRVSEIQANYKKGLGLILGNNQLTGGQRRLSIDSLVNEKNRQLETLLGEDQRNLMIPPAERKRTWRRDTTARINH